MKVYSIGRDLNCNIVINDRTDVISRRHAILTVMNSGKMTITDQSSNGTYVNGIRISSNVPVPVTRKDNISFAHVARLNWDVVPKTGADYLRWVILTIIALIILAMIIFGCWRLIPQKSNRGDIQPVLVDSNAIKEKIRKEEERRNDSIKKAIEDSIAAEKAKKENDEKIKAGKDKKKQNKTDAAKRKAEEQKKAEEAKRKAEAEKKVKRIDGR